MPQTEVKVPMNYGDRRLDLHFQIGKCTDEDGTEIRVDAGFALGAMLTIDKNTYYVKWQDLAQAALDLHREVSDAQEETQA